MSEITVEQMTEAMNWVRGTTQSNAISRETARLIAAKIIHDRDRMIEAIADGAGMDTLDRFEPVNAFGEGAMNADPAGEWVRYDDVYNLLHAIPNQTLAHPDDLAVNRFAAAMKEKLAKKRAEGRGGWGCKDECSNEFLSQLLREHVGKGDPVDVGNLAMMIQQRDERIKSTSPLPSEGEKRMREALEDIAAGRGHCETCGKLADPETNYVFCHDDRRCSWAHRDAQDVARAALSYQRSKGGNGEGRE